MSQVVFLSSLWPERTSSASGHLLWKLIDAFQARDVNVIYGCSSQTDSKEHFIKELGQAGVSIHPIAPNDPAFDKWIAEIKPEYVVFDRFSIEEQFSWRVHDHSPTSVRILNTSDLHFLRRARDKKIDALTSEDFFRELASIYRSDLSLIVSDYELDLLVREVGVSEKIVKLYRPPYLPLSSVPAFEERANFTMIGNFMHPPNRDACFWMKESIWPLIRRRLPKAELHLYGAYPDRAISQLDSRETGFRVLGWTENAIETLSKYRVSLAPLRFGAGYKGKIIDSECAGTPFVTTKIGAEGLNGIDLRAQKEAPEEIADTAVKLHEQSGLWSELQSEGFKHVRKNFDEATNQKKLFEHITQIERELVRHRETNFTGSMLWYHAFRSTTYFSRWIEAKNAVAPRLHNQ